MLNIRYEKAAVSKEKPDPATLKFGKTYTDHMFLLNWNQTQGWHDARIVPFGDLSFNPAAIVFNYAVEIFEGLKAYRTAQGKVQLFRVEENGARMANSAARMTLPQLPVEDFVQAVNALVEVEKDWVPSQEGTSLYIRPVLMATTPDLALHASEDCLFYIICSPVGSYYAGGLQCNSIRVEEEDVRAVRGGTGFAKCGGNYACALRASGRAVADGYNDVLWLDGVERKYVEEVGGMNIMFRRGKTVFTPQLTGSVLPGITRKSVIAVLEKAGYTVEERRITVDEVEQLLQAGKLDEIWGCGTAAVISPVGRLGVRGKDYVLNGFQVGEAAHMLYDTLTGIQWGRIPDPYGWVTTVK